MNAIEAAENALRYVLDAVRGEKLLIVCDASLRNVGDAFTMGAINMGLWVCTRYLPPPKKVRRNVPPELADIIVSTDPDIYLNLLTGSEKETPFRIKLTRLEARKKRRIAHCPGITYDMLTEGAFTLSAEEYKRMQTLAQNIMMRLLGAEKVHLTTPKGTDITFSVLGRDFFTDTKFNWKTMKWLNIPVGEVIAGPVENSANGTIVCDLAIGGIGKIDQPITINVKNGQAVKVYGSDGDVVKRVKATLKTDEWSSFIGEFAIGINPKARLIDDFLEAEKLDKTAHIAFGNNADYPGGRNTAENHMDFLMSSPTIEITYADARTYTLVKNGRVMV